MWQADEDLWPDEYFTVILGTLFHRYPSSHEDIIEFVKSYGRSLHQLPSFLP